jgi:hypothetical protein
MRFEALRERLLKGGIAPRHIRRYLRELEEHYADLYAAQREAGLNEADAAMVARAQLGEDENLANAMLEQRDFRALSARFPWAVFPLAPPLVAAIGFAVPVLLLAVLSRLYRFWTGTAEFVAPGWYRLLAEALIGFANFAPMPLAMLLLAILVRRQRLSLLWLLPGALLLLPLVVDVQGEFPTAAELRQHKTGSLSVGMGWAWSGLPGRLGQELAAGTYSGLARQLLILLPPLALFAIRLSQRRKGDVHAV